MWRAAALAVQRHELGEDVLCVAYTPSAKYVAVALLDASIHILFADSFQLFLTMYGHKLPVLSVSAASDNTLLVSGSADKTIKLWGLDFGDCHRSLTGHDESVMSVAFVHDTHYFFSASKDGTIRYWDADSFDHILTLRGHHADVWGIVPSRSGKLLASVSRDRSLRLWTRTDDQVRGKRWRGRDGGVHIPSERALHALTMVHLAAPPRVAGLRTGGARGRARSALRCRLAEER